MDSDITEVSDPRDMTIDDPAPPVPEVQILKGKPTDEEIAALATVLAAAGGRTGARAAGTQPLGPPGRQAALFGQQLAARHAAGTDPHAPMTRVVLGSASTGRLSVLRGAGIDPLVIVSQVDEDALIAAQPGAGPAAVVSALAEAKADAVAAVVPAEVAADCVVIGADSMLLLDGALCGKPGTPRPRGRNGRRWRAAPASC